jgi:tRNA modification GTPase
MSAPGSEATILALGSLPGASASACLRLSGARAIEAVARLAPLAAEGLRGLPGWRGLALTLRIQHGVVKAWASVFRAPRSYTGEDLVELLLPGNPALLGSVARALLEAGNEGVRWASPGELTLRAFLAGKLDLSQAESVAALIHASSEAEAQAAQRGLRGELRDELAAIDAGALEALAFIEACLDFPDEDLAAFPLEPVLQGLGAAREQACRVRQTSIERLPASGTLRVVLAGLPNAGKSSLLNALLGRPAALASAVPGTTRDPVRGTTTHRGQRLEWIDLAGTLDAGFQDFGGARPGEEPMWDVIRRMTLAEIAAADVVAWVFDASVETGQALAALDQLAAPRKLLVAQKCDLLHPGEAQRLRERAPCPVLVSAVTGLGLAALAEAVVAAAAPSGSSPPLPARFVLSAHQSAQLGMLIEALDRALGRLGEGALELAALDLRDAREALGSLTGAVTRDAVLDVIFSRFCLGK